MILFQKNNIDLGFWLARELIWWFKNPKQIIMNDVRLIHYLINNNLWIV